MNCNDLNQGMSNLCYIFMAVMLALFIAAIVHLMVDPGDTSQLPHDNYVAQGIQ